MQQEATHKLIGGHALAVNVGNLECNDFADP
jgi:hypothetical protein